MFDTPFVHEAQNKPLAVNIGSSSVPSPFSDIKRSYRFFKFFYNSLCALSFSTLSANQLARSLISSLSLIKLASNAFKPFKSAFLSNSLYRSCTLTLLFSSIWRLSHRTSRAIILYNGSLIIFSNFSILNSLSVSLSSCSIFLFSYYSILFNNPMYCSFEHKRL